MSVAERKKQLSIKKLCFNCTGAGIEPRIVVVKAIAKSVMTSTTPLFVTEIQTESQAQS